MARYLERDPVASLPASGVTAGSYTNADITVNSQGIITSAANGTAGVTTLGALTDVDLSGLAVNQFIRYDGADWVPHALVINSVDDVDVNSPVVGEVLSWDGTDWVNSTISSAGGLTAADIGVTVQAWDADLDALAALTGTGYLVRTGAGTYAERTFQAGEAIALTNDSGVAGNTEISLDIDSLANYSTIEGDEDFLVFYNTDVGMHEKILVDDFFTENAPLLSVGTVGVGAAVFDGMSGSQAQFRSINNGNSGISVGLSGSTIEISVSSTLNTIGLLTPALNNFIVGTGATWAAESPADARTSLGLGTMALEAATDYLALAGGTMSGNINMGNNFITSLLDPVNPQDAATMNYVDDHIANITAGDGLISNVMGTNTIIDVGAGTGILVNTNDIELDVGFTDGRYYTQTELSDTTSGTEGADLIGTDTKVNLGNADTVEEALEYLNANFPPVRFRQDISVWNLEITFPSATRSVVNDIEVARFNSTDDSAIYKDIMLPPDFDNSIDFNLYVGVAKSTAAAGVTRWEIASQSNGGGFTIHSTVSFDIGSVTNVGNISFTIPAAGFSSLDIMTLRLRRVANSDAADTYANNADFFGAFITQ